MSRASSAGGPPVTTLAATLDRLRSDLAQAQPPARLPAAARRAVAARRPRARWVRWSGAVACGLVLFVSVLLMVPPPGPVTSRAAVSAADVVVPLVPLVPLEQWPGGGAQAGWLVRAELTADRLATLGLPYDPARAADTVQAEVLVDPAGRVLALRLPR